MSQLKSSQSNRRCPIGFEAHRGSAPALDRPMILFDDVVEVRARTHEDIFPTMILATEPAQAQVTGLMAIQGDLARPSRCATRGRLAEESHGRRDPTSGMKQRVDRLSFLVDGMIEVARFRPGPNVGLIDAPGRADGLRPAVPTPLVLGHVPIDPAACPSRAMTTVLREAHSRVRQCTQNLSILFASTAPASHLNAPPSLK
jgi:hypothetical protein